MPDKNSKIHNNSYDMPNTESPQSNETTEQADPSTLSPEQTEDDLDDERNRMKKFIESYSRFTIEMNNNSEELNDSRLTKRNID